MIFTCAANDSAHSNGCGLLPERLNRPGRYGDLSTYSKKIQHASFHNKHKWLSFKDILLNLRL